MPIKEDKIYQEKIKKISKLINDSEVILIGIGAGMSASGGLNYMNTDFFKKHFPQYYKLGFKNNIETMGSLWDLTSQNVTAYWGYWANHINTMRFESPLTKPYIYLSNILKDKKYFICSTNADGQIERSNVDQNKIYAPQGNYKYFQCIKPCEEKIYDDEPFIKNMINNMADEYHISEDTIPYCPNCGNYLIPNLRKDNKFIEKPHIKNKAVYKQFINDSLDKNTLLLEFGVGYNTPVIIRFPFEEITYKNPNSHLVRFNLTKPEVPKAIAKRSISMPYDINQSLEDLV